MLRSDNRPRFVHECELAPTPQQARILAIRFNLGRQFYNTMLGEALGRLKRCRRDPRWREAGQRKRTGQKREAKALYTACKREYGFSEFALTGLVKRHRVKQFAE